MDADQQRQAAVIAQAEAEEKTQLAKKQEQQALKEKQRADQRTKESQRNESLFLANQAETEIDKQHFLEAAILSLKGLPKPLDDLENHRPYIGQAGVMLSQAISKLPHSHQLLVHDTAVNSAAFSPDSQRVVTASDDNTARVWDANTGEILQQLVGHEDVVNSATFSPDGQRVVTASGDHTARVWDVNTGEVLQVLAGHENNVTSATFSPDGQWVVTASWDGTARVWSTPFANWQALVNGAWPLVWSAATTLQREELLLYLLNIEITKWHQIKHLIQKINYLRTQVLQLQLTPKQQQAWLFYLLDWLWQHLIWEDVELTKREQFYQTVISTLGKVWQVTPEQQRWWQESSPNYYNYLLLEKLESVWNDWPLEQQVPLLIQLAALPSLVTNGSFERDNEAWIAEDDNYINQVGNWVMNPYHEKQFLALGSEENANNHVSQTIPTIPQHRYALSFAFATPADAVEPMQVLWNGKVLDELSAPAEEWQVHTYTVTAVKEETKLEFQGEGYVDAVKVTALE